MNTININGFVLSEGKKGVQKLPFGRYFMKTRWTGALTKTVLRKYGRCLYFGQDDPKVTLGLFTLGTPFPNNSSRFAFLEN